MKKLLFLPFFTGCASSFIFVSSLGDECDVVPMAGSLLDGVVLFDGMKCEWSIRLLAFVDFFPSLALDLALLPITATLCILSN